MASFFAALYLSNCRASPLIMWWSKLSTALLVSPRCPLSPSMNSLLLVMTFSTLMTLSSTQDQRRPTISFITQPEIVADIGGSAEMKCSVQYAGDYPVVWMRLDPVDHNNDLIISTSTTLILTDPRFHIDLVKSTSTYSLRIDDIQETDGAIYQCQVLVSLTDKATADVPLIVRRPPVISDNSTRSVVASEGQRVVLHCYASGYPPPTIYWRRQDNAVLPTNTSVYKGTELIFDNVKKEHRGTYFCVATNVVGRGDRRNVDVEVEFAPRITIPRRRLGQALQFDMDLECNVEAYPPPAIQWFRGNAKAAIPITNNQHYFVSHFAHDDEYTDTILRVITIEKKQYDLYFCKATNVLGEAQGQVELFETVIPICPPACDGYNTISGSHHELKGSILTLLLLPFAFLASPFNSLEGI